MQKLIRETDQVVDEIKKVTTGDQRRGKTLASQLYMVLKS